MAGPTRAELSKVIDAKNDRIMELQAVEGNYARELDALRKENAAIHQRLNEEIEFAQVLMGDRDRLTAALELCTRRLASPYAERQLARAGWRGANTVAGQGTDVANTKSALPLGAAGGVRHWTPSH